jgi:uncharacterized glyoxalase superfamily protein PhnB
MSIGTTPLPSGHNTVNPFVITADARGFVRFVEAVFGGAEVEQVRTPDRDGSIIHAEVVVGNATIMLSDTKEGWPFTPAFLQIYVADARECIDRAQALGATLITPISDFYGGFRLARVQDPWRNIWWLYEPDTGTRGQGARESDTDWHDRGPSVVYATLLDAMAELARVSR